jgi:Bacterial nucleoid DNA-binding protein
VSTTRTRADLIERAVAETGLSRAEVSDLLDDMLRLMGAALMQCETVKLTGFGSLQVRSRAARTGRNPRTGTEHEISPRHTVVFTPSAQLRLALAARVSAGNVRESTREVATVDR